MPAAPESGIAMAVRPARGEPQAGAPFAAASRAASVSILACSALRGRHSPSGEPSASVTVTFRNSNSVARA